VKAGWQAGVNHSSIQASWTSATPAVLTAWMVAGRARWPIPRPCEVILKTIVYGLPLQAHSLSTFNGSSSSRGRPMASLAVAW
jgi:hypothetical protein